MSFFPFFGGVDDRVALRFVLQLAQNSNITATVIHFNMPIQSGLKRPVSAHVAETSSARASSTKLEFSERIDTDTLYAGAAQDVALLHTLRDSLPVALTNRVVFVEVATTAPIDDCLAQARQEIGQSPRNAGDLIVVGRGRHSRMAETYDIAGHMELRKTLGTVAETMITGGVRGSVLVIQAGGRGLDA